MIDLSKVRDRLNSIQSTNSEKDSSLWKPSPGSQVIRIVPYKFNKGFPFIELYFHYGINGKTILSPKSFDQPDPIQEFSEKLKSSGNRDDFQLGMKFNPKMRIYAPIIVRTEESHGVRFWGFGKMVYHELLSIMTDEDYGDITDPNSGRDIVVEYKTAEELGKSFPETKVRVKPNQSILYEDVKNTERLLDNQKDIKDIFKVEDYDSIKTMLNDWLNPTQETEDTKSVEEVLVDTKVHEDAESAFDELFDK